MSFRLNPNNPEHRKILEKHNLLKPYEESIRNQADKAILDTVEEIKEKKTSKYGNKKTYYGNLVFDSKYEYECYITLKDMERSGIIKDLKTQVKIDFIYNEIKIWGCRLDFSFESLSGELIYADSKTEVTANNRIWRATVKMTKAFEDREILVFFKGKTNVYQMVKNRVYKRVLS